MGQGGGTAGYRLGVVGGNRSQMIDNQRVDASGSIRLRADGQSVG